MEVDMEELVKLLGLHEEKGDKSMENEDIHNYIQQLTSCGIDKLVREGLHLQDEKLLTLDQTLRLVSANYKTFIHTAECTKKIYSNFNCVEDHLSNLQHGLPVLKSNVEDFLHSCKSISTSRKSTSSILAKHTQLLEILELPQLMETCVRNGYYDDALDILSHVKRLEKKSLQVAIIESVIKDIKGVSRLMLGQLFSQLRSSITLPQCLKIVGILRRLDVYTEAELRLKFLQARDSWFTNIIKSIPKDDAYHHICKVVEASRVHLFDIVTQYRAIFSDDETRFSIDEQEINEQSIFYGWILHKVNQFLNILEIDLNRGVGNNVESVLSQCMFFGQSFSRVGSDFRNLLIKIFQKAAFSQFEADVRSANFKFDESLSTFSLLDASLMKADHFITEAEQQGVTSAPLSLMEFPPLAEYANGLAKSFNALRQCCPLVLCKRVVELLEKSLSKVVTALLDLYRLENAGFTNSENTSFSRMCQILADSLLSHINNCLRLLFPLKMVSSVTGVSISQLEIESFGQVSLEVVDALSSFLPKILPTTISELPERKVIFELNNTDASEC